MARYVIYAADQMFGGLHGMNICEVIDAISLKEAEEFALSRSYDVIDSYNCIYEDLEESAKDSLDIDDITPENEDAFYEAFEALRSEDTEYSVWVIDENKAKDFPTEQLDRMYYDDPEGFVEDFCIK